MKSKRVKIIVILISVIVVAAAIIGIIAAINHNEEQRFHNENLAQRMRLHVNNNVPRDIGMVFKVDEEGFDYPYFEPNEEQEALVKELLSYYNADPSTTMPLAYDEFYYTYTEGVKEFYEDGSYMLSNVHAFFVWCWETADLVYSDASTDTRHEPGEAVDLSEVSNYQFLTDNGRVVSDYQFSWEYEQQHSTTTPSEDPALAEAQ